MERCKVIGCNKEVKRKELCSMHLTRLYRHGDVNANHRITHHRYNTKEYLVWNSMKNRCLNPNSQFYKHYGGRGIVVCDEWLKFENFYADMGDAPRKYTLDRIDNDGNYEPKNCRWATQTEQLRNTRRNVLNMEKAEEIRQLKGQGVKIKEISKRMDINYYTVRNVIYRGIWR